MTKEEILAAARGGAHIVIDVGTTMRVRSYLEELASIAGEDAQVEMYRSRISYPGGGRVEVFWRSEQMRGLRPDIYLGPEGPHTTMYRSFGVQVNP